MNDTNKWRVYFPAAINASGQNFLVVNGSYVKTFRDALAKGDSGAIATVSEGDKVSYVNPNAILVLEPL
jgi:hypothetical protein